MAPFFIHLFPIKLFNDNTKIGLAFNTSRARSYRLKN